MRQVMRTVSLKLPDDLDRALTELARRRRSTRSALIREAIEVLTSHHSRSVGDLAGDLAGSLSGRSDLSSGADPLSGYGE